MIMQAINSSLKLLMNLSKIQAANARKFDRLGAHGMSFNDFFILYLLRQAPNQQFSRTALAEKIGLTASGITRLLLPLEKIGLVARATNERDARVSYVKLTETGLRVYEEARPAANSIAQEIVPDTYFDQSLSATELFGLLGGNII